MSAGYDSNKIDDTTATGRKNFVRLLTGDTLSSDFLLDDNEIGFFLTQSANNVIQAAVESCVAIAAGFSRKADIAIGKAKVNASKRAEAYLRLSYELKSKELPTMKAGGFSKSEREDIEQDDDVIPSHFKTGDMDFPGAASGENVNDSRLNDDDC